MGIVHEEQPYIDLSIYLRSALFLNMSRTINIEVRPSSLDDDSLIKESISRELPQDFGPFQYLLLKRSLDARGRIFYRLRYEVYAANEAVPDHQAELEAYKDVSQGKPVFIIGAGPAGLFAALRCLHLGFKPIIIERGKDVRERRRDLARLTKEHIVDEDSNYCFGEGGAGAYSDGKLYTRSKKRGDVDLVLRMLQHHGAPGEINIDAHPHIGTNKLPEIIAHIRECILSHGGEIHFEERLIDIEVKEGTLKSIRTSKAEYETKHLILATGHSARDIFKLLADKKISIEYKPFSLGVRVEHPQELIDKIQYRKAQQGDILPPASYSLVCQVDGRGAYSFCMCPGGIIAPCATAPGEVVTNGWSPSKRNNPYANSGIVVEVKEEDLKPYGAIDPLRGMYFQSAVERAACYSAGGNQTAPAQRLTDFLTKKVSSSLPECSYFPGLASVDLFQVLPASISHALHGGFKEFGKKMPAYITEQAVIVATESRTSSPVRIPRDSESMEHPEVKGLYPAGEGAGYAGGIVSAAIDGMNCVDRIAAL